MTFSKEQLSQAFIDVLTERVPDLSDRPDHVFSERFEKKMDRLIHREAAHPWAISHTFARNLIAAAIVIILLFIMCMSVGAIRETIFHFFQLHFDTHDDIVFEIPNMKEIEQEYSITNIPSGFSLEYVNNNRIETNWLYNNEIGDYIYFVQAVPTPQGRLVDNERSKNKAIVIDGCGVFVAQEENIISLSWDNNGYVFWLTIS